MAHIGRQVAGGLAYAHARGIVHRDIKPSNLLLDTEGVVWITDFGLAKGDDEGLTQSGDILGTIRYMAPERLRGEGDARADVYALGLSVYELLTLRSGFASSDRLALIEQIKTEDPQRPRDIDARIPRDLETIVLKAIEKDPRARYQSAEAMGEDLRRFLADEPIRARQVSAMERGWRWCHRHKAVAGLLGLIALALSLGTAVSTYFAIAANRNASLADVEAKRANREALNATKEAQRAKDEKSLSDHRLYLAVMNLARLGWRDNQVNVTQRHLESLKPTSPGDADLRGFEWYWDSGIGQELLTLNGYLSEVLGVAFDPGGLRLASASWDFDVKLWDATKQTPEQRMFEQARSVVLYLIRKKLPTAEVRDRIHRDATISEPVRAKALALVGPLEHDALAGAAERRVEALFSQALLRPEVLESLRRDSALSEPQRQLALALAEEVLENAVNLDRASWSVVRQPGARAAAIDHALRQAEAACRLIPDRSLFLSTLGLAQYRAGRYREALVTLERADRLNNAVDHGSSVPRDLAFLALARHRLGQAAEAGATLDSLHALIKTTQWSKDEEAQAFLREAEVIELDEGFPGNPFSD